MHIYRIIVITEFVSTYLNQTTTQHQYILTTGVIPHTIRLPKSFQRMRPNPKEKESSSHIGMMQILCTLFRIAESENAVLKTTYEKLVSEHVRTYILSTRGSEINKVLNWQWPSELMLFLRNHPLPAQIHVIYLWVDFQMTKQENHQRTTNKTLIQVPIPVRYNHLKKW